MSSTYGDIIKLSIFGQSHGAAIGMTLDGVPAGLPVDMNKLISFLQRRAPGQWDYSTPRKESDTPEFLSGITNDFTCGSPIAAIIRNSNTRSQDYSALRDQPRPGHADYCAQIKYKGFQDVAGGGHFSGRLTAPVCIAGGLCKQWLENLGVNIAAHIVSIGNVYDNPKHLDWISPDIEAIRRDFPVLSEEAGEKMRQIINQTKSEGDSLGGVIECVVTGLPAGIGHPMFGGMESRIAQIVYGIPAVKGLEFGSGFGGSCLRGSENNDPYEMCNGKVITKTNNCGGILGGITNGMPLIFQVAVKPTPSIAKMQQTVSLSDQKNISLSVEGRHDPCIVPRAVPVIEAAAAIALFDAYLLSRKE